MEIKKIKHMLSKHTKVYEAGLKAAEQRNYKYAMDMFRSILREEPGVLEVRDKLREVQVQRIGGEASPFRKFLANIMSMSSVVAVPKFSSDGNYHEALDSAEKAMSQDPTNPKFCLLVASAAEAADMPVIGQHALETADRYNPDNPEIVEALANTYAILGKGTEATACRERLVKIDKPNSAKHKAALGKLTAEQAADIRDPYELPPAGSDVETKKGKDQIPSDRDAIEKQIRLVQRNIESDDSTANRKRLGDLFAAAGQYDQALENYYVVLELSGGSDAVVDYAISDAVTRKYNQLIVQCQEKLNNPATTPEEKGEISAQLQQFTAEKYEQLVERARSRCQRNPHSTRCGIEFALLLWESGEIGEAINNLQQFKGGSQMKEQVLFFLGRCYVDNGKNDSAIEAFNGLLALLPRMNRMKKEALYYLGKSYEGAGNTADAEACFKRIYGYDEGYRDITEIVDKIYHKEQMKAI